MGSIGREPSPQPTTIHFMPIQSPADYGSMNSTTDAFPPSAPDASSGAPLPTIFLSQDASSMSQSGAPTVTISGGSSAKITRPRNAFMLFRSNFCKERIAAGVERDHRHISRIVGHCWHMLSDVEKEEWKILAEREKMDHQRRHPGWKFRPSPREKKPLKRKVKRNGPADLARSRTLAELVRQGKSGADLESALLESSRDEEPPSPDVGSSDSASSNGSSAGSPEFRYDMLDSPAGYSVPLISGEQQQASGYPAYHYTMNTSADSHGNLYSSSSSLDYYAPQANFSWMPADYYDMQALGQYDQQPGFDSHGLLLSPAERSYGFYETPYEGSSFK